MSMTRRAFVGVGATALGATALGGAAKAWGKNDDLLRPPVVLDEDVFLSRCLRCYRCVSVCHTGAIVPATLDDGVIEIRTPKLNFHRGYCDFCNDCIDVCPTDAITPCDPYNPAEGRIGVAVVDEERCIAYFNGCSKCIEVCPYEALSATESGLPVVDESKCNGCGLCVKECPALVYRSFSGGTARGIEVVKRHDDAN